MNRYASEPTPADCPLPPQNLEAEQAVLGSMLIDYSGETTDNAMQEVTAADFYRDTHRLIFEAITALRERSEPADILTLSEELGKHGRLEQVGGRPYLTELMNSVPTAAHVTFYARCVARESLRRRLIGVADHLATWARDEAVEPDTLVERAEQEIFQLVKRSRSRDPIPIGDLIPQEFARLESTEGQQVTGVATGFTVLDWKTSGFQPSDLILLAARPSMGKTAMALNVGAYAAKHTGPVLLFSLEMNAAQIVTRLLSAEARIDSVRMRRGDLTNADEIDWPRLLKVGGQLGDLPFWIDDANSATPAEIRGHVRRFCTRQGTPALLILDYIQMMASDTEKPTAHAEMASVSRALKGIAREANCPFLVLSQLSRATERRQDHRPQLADLRESGALEADADLVMMLYRPSYYRHDDKEEETTAALEVVDVLISKHRNGPTGLVRLGFQQAFARFENLHEEINE